MLPKISCLLVLLAGCCVHATYRKYWESRTKPTVDQSACFENGAYLSSAFSCQNEMGAKSCEVFEKVANTLPTTLAERDDACLDPHFQEAAGKCRRSCGTCCEHERFKGCSDKASAAICKKITSDDTTTAGTTQRATYNLCGVKAFHEVMLFACPKTCGLCDIHNARVQAQANLKSGSKAKSTKPEIPRSALTIPREKGCKNSPPKGKDNGYCKRRMYRCEEGQHVKEMDKHCRMTCAKCLPPKFKCKDLDAEKCKRWDARNFCLSGGYPLSAKLHHCSATCKMCPP